MKPKIIGTGLSGLVGSRIRELLGDKFEFVDFSLETGVDILNFSILKEAFEKVREAEVVLHLAAFTDTQAAWEQRGDKKGLCYRLNVEGTRNVVRLCQQYGQHLIYFSTDFVFDGEKEGVYTEDDQPHPIEWYGQTKYWGEEEVKKNEAGWTILRIAYPFRARFSPKKDLVRRIIEGLKTGSLYPMFADQIITPTFIDDIVRGTEYFIREKKEGIFHLVGLSFHSPYQLAQMVAEIFGFDPGQVKKGSLVDYLKNQPPGGRPWQKRLALSNQKVRAEGIKMRTTKEALLEIKNQLSL